MSRLSKEEFNKRMKLYNEGLSDCQMAKILNKCPQVIQTWRKRNNLPAHYKIINVETGEYKN